MSKITTLDWEWLILGPYPPLFLAESALCISMLPALLLLAVHIVGKRGQLNLSPMQQMLLIALGSAAGEVMFYAEVSIAGAAADLVDRHPVHHCHRENCQSLAHYA